ncbi:MAG: hypothetical protein Ta2G_10650 [Termitinemataceae bacterium]|nr:MAG: hypothetical protein Ta2G_10650 [Termitinemataceae bacterium]
MRCLPAKRGSTRKKNRVFYKLAIAVFIVAFAKFRLFHNSDPHRAIMSFVATALFAGLLFLLYFFGKNNYFLMQKKDNDQEIFFHYNKPDKKTFDEFLKTFNAKRRDYYRQQYFVLYDWEYEEVQKERMEHLRKHDYITEAEYTEALDKIAAMHAHKPIGFTS